VACSVTTRDAGAFHYNVYARGRIVLLRPVSRWFRKTNGQAKVSLERSVGQNEKIGWAPGSTRKFFLSIFWRTGSIVCLVEYPEKTDRLEQRQAAGKIPQAAFFVVGTDLRSGTGPLAIASR
jgi:hypothetical protein